MCMCVCVYRANNFFFFFFFNLNKIKSSHGKNKFSDLLVFVISPNLGFLGSNDLFTLATPLICN